MKTLSFTHILVAVAILLAACAAVAVNFPQSESLSAGAVKDDSSGIERFIAMCGAKTPDMGSCSSIPAIKKSFGIDLREEIATAHGKMKYTARLIAKGDLREDAYRDCRRSGSCAKVPLLPPGTHPDSEGANTLQAIHIRKAFWDLVEKDKLTPAVCDFIQICVIGRKVGAMEEYRPRSSKKPIE